MPLRIIEHGTGDYLEMIKLRDDILRKPLGLSFSAEELVAERDDILVAAFDKEQLIACCVLSVAEKGSIRLRQMAVSPSVQGKGIGRDLIHFAENVARDQGFTRMIMHARSTAIGFYEKMGYTVTGNEFVEVTIPHYTMQKTLTVS
jgi:N-acetylglutamate synthase-like GNAT family acetyltransferase